jgi:antirestriction protein ArdC
MTIYQEITDSIISELEKGAAPWLKPWNAPAGADKNIVSQRPYRGINRLLLAMIGGAKGYTNPAWGTYKQWNDLGGQVRKGEKAAKIIFWSQAKTTTPEGEDKAYAFAKAYFVFNVEQVDGIDIIVSDDKQNDNQRIEKCEKTLVSSGARIVHGGDTACFIPSSDLIRMPEIGTFNTTEHYYATAFHELTHWTSAKSRCDRDLSKGRFGNSEYAFEELVAELGAAFLCSQHGITGDLRHAGYIESWLKCLKNDSKAIFKASGLAQAASDYVMSFATSEQVTDDELLAA